jgi:hypothetical protein
MRRSGEELIMHVSYSGRCTLGAGKNFRSRSSAFLFAFAVLFGFLYGVLGSVFVVFGCASMLVSVTFYVGMRGD